MFNLSRHFKIIFIITVFLSVIFLLFRFLNLPPQHLDQNYQKKSEILVSGIVPHHLLANDIIDNFFKELINHRPELIFLISPDHFNQNSFHLSQIITDKNGANILSSKKLAIDEPAIQHDHGITNLLPYFKKYLPRAEVVPILLASWISQSEVEQLVNDITLAFPNKNKAVIASVDFSHYLPQNALLFHDEKSIRVLNNFEIDKFNKIDVDSAMALYACRLFAFNQQLNKIKLINHKTSFDYPQNTLETESLDKEGGTSYYSVIYQKEGGTNIEKLEVQTFLFVGDLMLGRGVSEEVEANGNSYLFQNIKYLSRGVDEIVGNLEGPIIASASEIPHQSLNFGFPPEVLNWLKDFNFTALSLANNHIADRGLDGFNQTQKYLAEKNIKALGAFNKCDSSALTKIRDHFYILAINLTFPNKNQCLKEAVSAIQSFKKESPQDIVIVMPHWGEEYQMKSSSFQKQAAHQLIDAGADLIIGSHPHVIQEIEDYNGRLIFYSLGNFVFDQYFSSETQKHLVVGAVFNNNDWRFYLIPLKSQKSQLQFMSPEEEKEALNELALKSSLSLQSAILDGKIIKRLKDQ